MQGWFTPLKISDLTSNGPSGKSALVAIMMGRAFFAYRSFSRITAHIRIFSFPNAFDSDSHTVCLIYTYRGDPNHSIKYFYKNSRERLWKEYLSLSPYWVCCFLAVSLCAIIAHQAKLKKVTAYNRNWQSLIETPYWNTWDHFSRGKSPQVSTWAWSYRMAMASSIQVLICWLIQA